MWASAGGKISAVRGDAGSSSRQVGRWGPQTTTSSASRPGRPTARATELGHDGHKGCEPERAKRRTGSVPRQTPNPDCASNTLYHPRGQAKAWPTTMQFSTATSGYYICKDSRPRLEGPLTMVAMPQPQNLSSAATEAPLQRCVTSRMCCLRVSPQRLTQSASGQQCESPLTPGAALLSMSQAFVLHCGCS